MSTRKWKASNSVRRRSGDSPSVHSTSSSASIFSVENRTTESPDEYSQSGSTKSYFSSFTDDREQETNHTVSSSASVSSMGTYAYAFMLSPSEGSVPSKGLVDRKQSQQTEQQQSPLMVPMPTLDESISENEDTFLENFLSMGGDSQREGRDRDDPNQKSFMSKSKYLGLFLNRCAPVRLVIASIAKKFFERRAQDHSHSNKYSKYYARSQIFESQNYKRIALLLKVTGFLSLIAISCSSLKTAAKKQPDLLSPSSPNTNDSKQKLLRHHADGSGSNKKGKSKLQHHQYHLDARHKGVRIPPVFLNLADIDEPPSNKDQNLPFFWHIPRSGGTTMNNILAGCMKLTLASSYGREDKDKKLKTLDFGFAKYVNVALSSHDGIERAKKLNLASSGLADVVISSHVYEASFIFSPTHHGRLFTIMRHPIERAVSLFHHTQDLHWRRGNVATLKDITMEEYFKGGMGENNWMTRFLSNQRTKELSAEDLVVAKEVLRRKCLVGLLSDKGESMTRFLKYFGWEHLVNKGQKETECLEKELDYAWPMKHRHDPVEEGTDLWNLITKFNIYDLQLYEYAKLLFKEQAGLFH